MSELEKLHDAFINLLIKEKGIVVTDSVEKLKIIRPRSDGKLFFVSKSRCDLYKNLSLFKPVFHSLDTLIDNNDITEIMFVTEDDNPMATYYHELCMDYVNVEKDQIYVIPDIKVSGREWMIETLFKIKRFFDETD